ncbi:hypothetical protein NC653_040557 [Populus alba x Populus x berolinensis]|uniref:Uncharacterized protein n=1 Tax=Populus alba x Populus x berolinensis TaxID=444605 RepID=A0AAD6L7H3_9ROSI|nr:hypothetical protein NC653_040557 [Populus alba x Populus x berolinensis]
MASTEDFSFPRITNPLPHFAISPSLWRVSSLVYPDYCYEDDERELPFFKQSFSFTTCQELKIESIEEKMDRLWEKFNDDELQRASSDSLGGKKGSYSVDSLDSECARGELKHLYRVKKELKISKSDTNIMISASTQSKRQQIVMVFKVLKKIFLHPISSKGLKVDRI